MSIFDDLIEKRKKKVSSSKYLQSALDNFSIVDERKIEYTSVELENDAKNNKKFIDDILREDMVIFRNHILKKVGGSRKKVMAHGGQNCFGVKSKWEDFVGTTIYEICGNYSFDKDVISGTSDFFMNELYNENTKLTWSSYCSYYENKSKVSKRKKINKNTFIDNLYTTIGIDMSEIKIDDTKLKSLEEELNEIKKKIEIETAKNKDKVVLKMLDDIEKYKITLKDLKPKLVIPKKRKRKSPSSSNVVPKESKTDASPTS